MAARLLTFEEYSGLARKVMEAGGRDPVKEGPSAVQVIINFLKQVHRLLSEGRKPEELTLAEAELAKAFAGMPIALVLDKKTGEWQPGIDEELSAPLTRVESEIIRGVVTDAEAAREAVRAEHFAALQRVDYALQANADAKKALELEKKEIEKLIAADKAALVKEEADKEAAERAGINKAASERTLEPAPAPVAIRAPSAATLAAQKAAAEKAAADKRAADKAAADKAAAEARRRDRE